MPSGAPLRADRAVVSPLHVRILGAIARSEEAYGALDVRLEGGTALAAYYVGHRQSEKLDLLGRRHASSGPVGESERRSRFRALVADLEECDPGLAATQVGQALARGLDRPVLGAFPLRMLATVQEAEIQETIRLGLEECARLTRARADWEASSPEPSGHSC
jgi:hypothetical protein